MQRVILKNHRKQGSPNLMISRLIEIVDSHHIGWVKIHLLLLPRKTAWASGESFLRKTKGEPTLRRAGTEVLLPPASRLLDRRQENHLPLFWKGSLVRLSTAQGRTTKIISCPMEPIKFFRKSKNRQFKKRNTTWPFSQKCQKLCRKSKQPWLSKTKFTQAKLRASSPWKRPSSPNCL